MMDVPYLASRSRSSRLVQVLLLFLLIVEEVTAVRRAGGLDVVIVSRLSSTTLYLGRKDGA